MLNSNLCLAALLVALPLMSSSLGPVAEPMTPAAGPGGVLDAVEAFLEAQDGGDAAALQKRLAQHAPGARFGYEAGGQPRMEEGPGSPLFVDRGMGGELLRAASPAEYARLATLKISAIGKGGAQLDTKIVSLRADCPSGNCSYAVVDFIRTYDRGDGEELAIPMQASALLQHTKDGFRIFHWHASVGK